MTSFQPGNPLHGVALEKMLTELSTGIGWEVMGRVVPVRCVIHEPDIKSSLRFLRRTPWARAKVEVLCLRHKGQ